MQIIYFCFVILGGTVILTHTLYCPLQALRAGNHMTPWGAGSQDPWFRKRVTVGCCQHRHSDNWRHQPWESPATESSHRLGAQQQACAESQ